MKSCYFCDGAGCEACIGEEEDETEQDEPVTDPEEYSDDELEDLFRIDENDI